MAFFKSIGDIANAVSSAKELASATSGIIQSVKGNTVRNNENKENEVTKEEGTKFSKKIEKLIALVLADGELNEEESEMLSRLAEKEGYDPDEVLFVVRKRLKISRRSGNQPMVVESTLSLSPAKRLASEISEIDKKFDAAIESIYAGDSSTASAILDTLTGGASGLAISIGKKLFSKSDEDKVMELEEQREIQISHLLSSVTTPPDFQDLLELLEYVSNQSKQRDEDGWDDIHLALSKRGMIVAGDNEEKKNHITMYIHKSLLPKKKKKFGLF